MASAPPNRVLYRSPDALQNLRVTVSLTRVSGPRADRAAELTQRLAQERGEAQQKHASAVELTRQHTAAGAGAIFSDDPPDSHVSDQIAASRAQQAAAAATALAPASAFAPTVPPSDADTIVDGGDDTQTAPATNAPYVPQIGGRRSRQSQLVRGDTPHTWAAAHSGTMPAFDPYGAPSVAASPAPAVAPALAVAPAPAVAPGTPTGRASPGFPGRAERPARGDSLGDKARSDVPGEQPGPVVESAQNVPPLNYTNAPPETEPSFDRVVAWQEKIFSVAEATRRMDGSPSAAEQPAASELDRKYDAMVRENGLTGETIYTYVSSDRFADDLDAEKTVTTSATERVNGLFRAVFGSPAARVFAANAFGKDATKLRTEIAKGGRKRAGGPVTFVICADCGPLELPSDHPVMVARQNTHQSGHPEGQEVLMTIEAFPDGSLALSPDFNGDSPDDVYRIERRDGSVWEYSVRNASKRDETNLEKRQKDIAPTAAMRALQLARRRRQGPGAFVPPPLDSPERLVFLGEIVSGRGFEHDNLYCEWALEFDPEVWKLEYDAKDGKPATAGVTQISKTTVYPDTGDGIGDGFFSAERRVAHWSLPIELCFVAKHVPTHRQYPVLFFQVSSYDKWDRYRPEGYGSLSLAPPYRAAPGRDVTSATPKPSPERLIKTWRAGGTVCDRIATHYVGGAPEIGNLSYVAAPKGGEEGASAEKVHSRLGFTADASGEIKIRAHLCTQRSKALSAGAASGVSALRGLLGGKFGTPGARSQSAGVADVDDDVENAAPGNVSNRSVKDDDVEDVVDRARARIAEARAQGRLDPDVSARATLMSRGGAGDDTARGAGRPMSDTSNTTNENDTQRQ